LTLNQGEAFAIVLGMLGLFAWDRLRYDVVGAIALSAAALTGVIPTEKVFQGFANPVLIIIASVLVIGRAITISGIVEAVMRPLLHATRTTSSQVGILTACVTFFSAFMKNIGTLGVFMPIAIQTAQRNERSPSCYLMPLAFGSLVGGTMTLIGTSPNLLISTVRQEVEGRPFGMFDFTPVGLPLAIIAVAFLAFGWRLLPKDRRGTPAPDQRFEVGSYISEAHIPAGSLLIGKTVGDLEQLSDGEISVTAIIREHGRRYIPRSYWVLFGGDLVVLRADPVILHEVVAKGGLALAGAGEIAGTEPKKEEVETVEAVVTAESPLIGQTPASLHLRQRFEVNLLAISRSGENIRTRLHRTALRVGDVVALQGYSDTLSETLTRLGCLPLAERNLALGAKRPQPLAIVILLIAMMLVAFGLLPVEVAFFVAAVVVILLRLLSLKEAYDAIDWPILVMLGCLIPVGGALKDTGADALIASALTLVAAHLPGFLAVGLVLVTSMLVAPFLHHAAAVLVMGPVAAAIAAGLGYQPDSFLMAVALGASCDFLTPIGHQNNALVMGPGGYHFGDYWRLGLPLSCLIAVLGTALIVRIWSL
jgi:di/tricarboxylate transporter